jgi:hypothetical protein
MTTRAEYNEQWMDEYRNKPGGPWLGRATMQANKEARVAAIEAALLALHTDEGAGHGPFVINHHVGTGAVITENQTLADAHQGTPRIRRCFCGNVYDSDDIYSVDDNRTYDGFTRDLREVRWPGFVWEGPEYPEQPRDTAAIRGVTVEMPTMIEGVRP